MVTTTARVIEDEDVSEVRPGHSEHFTNDHPQKDIANTLHKLSKRAPVFPFDPFFGPKFAKKAIKFGPKLALKKSVKLAPGALALKKTSPFLLKKKSVKTVPLLGLGAPLLGPLAVKAVIKKPKKLVKEAGGPLAFSVLAGGGGGPLSALTGGGGGPLSVLTGGAGNFDQENIRLTLLRIRNGLFG